MIKLDAILNAIYGTGLDEDDFAKIILKIRTALDDSFYEDPPSQKQKDILADLDILAANVREFYI